MRHMNCWIRRWNRCLWHQPTISSLGPTIHTLPSYQVNYCIVLTRLREVIMRHRVNNNMKAWKRNFLCRPKQNKDFLKNHMQNLWLAIVAYAKQKLLLMLFQSYFLKNNKCLEYVRLYNVTITVVSIFYVCFFLNCYVQLYSLTI